MFRTRYLKSLILAAAAAFAAACTADPVDTGSVETLDGAEPASLTIDFSVAVPGIDVSTCATLDKVAESRVSNLFVFLFNDRGERVYGRFFDTANRMESDSQLQDSKVDCWRVLNKSGDVSPSEFMGKVRLYAPEVTGGSLYILTNINADMVNISPEKLRFVQTLADLESMATTLNYEITERNGFFPMTGSAPDIEISGGRITSGGQQNFKVMLSRLDAKIQVKVRVAAGYEESTSRPATEGEFDGGTVVAFDEAQITDTKTLLWYVKTPFGREGKPHVIGGIEVPAGLDYQWVHFRINERDRRGNYMKNHAPYHPDEVMSILDFSKYIKDQKAFSCPVLRRR